MSECDRMVGMSNIEQMRLLMLVQTTFWYYNPYSAPIWIEDGIGYLTGCGQMKPLLVLNRMRVSGWKFGAATCVDFPISLCGTVFSWGDCVRVKVAP